MKIIHRRGAEFAETILIFFPLLPQRRRKRNSELSLAKHVLSKIEGTPRPQR
jgi:hypothetical protein